MQFQTQAKNHSPAACPPLQTPLLVLLWIWLPLLLLLPWQLALLLVGLLVLLLEPLRVVCVPLLLPEAQQR